MGREIKWKTLRHNGVAFPPDYVAQGLCVTIRGERVELTPEAEEMALAWAKKKDTPYVQDPAFAENFLLDFRKHLPPRLGDVKIGEIDFSEFYEAVERERKAKESLSREEKKAQAQARKAQRERLKNLYGFATVDGRKVEVANWLVEPPGLFLGRGSHPLRGRWKPRVRAEDVILNLDEEAPIPPGNWGGIVHDHSSMWLASWRDKLTQKMKYVWLSDTARLRQERDKAKYDNAMQLVRRVEKVRKHILKGLRSREESVKKIATVCYLIDKLAMRVGDEKDEDEADTVGASTLRVEHIRLEKGAVVFDFLGKDSVRWIKTIPLEGCDPAFLENIRRFSSGKRPQDPLFDGLNSKAVNKFLGKAMKRLTAKVFRTYHASRSVVEYLAAVPQYNGQAASFFYVFHAKMANLRAAITCNHKRSPPKNWELSLQRKEERLARLMEQTKSGRQSIKLKERIDKLHLEIELAKATREYNLNTSLKNYVDPRIFKAWAKSVGLDWKLLYPKSLQRKFMWASRSPLTWRVLLEYWNPTLNVREQPESPG